MKKRNQKFTSSKIIAELLICSIILVGIISLISIPKDNDIILKNKDNEDYGFEQNDQVNKYLTPLSSSIEGKQLWNVTWGGESGTDTGRNVAVDSLNNVYVAGPAGSFGVGTDMYLVKYNSSGAQLWNVTWGGDQLDVGYGVAVDSLDNVYISGLTESFGSGLADMCLIKYDSSGAQQWNATWGGSDYDVGYGVAVDSSDNVYVTGSTISFGAGLQDMMLVKYNSSGAQQWNTTWGGGSADYGYGVAVDLSDNVYVSGCTESFGAGGLDMFLAKYDSSGAQQWNATWGGGSNDLGMGVAVDSSDNVYVTGSTISFGAGLQDMMLVKYNSSGVQLWNTTWGGGLGEYGYGVAEDSADSVYVAGHTMTFGSGGWDMFLVKYDSSGAQQWNATWGGINHDYGFGVAVDSSDNAYLTGDTESFGSGSGYDMCLVKYEHPDTINPSWSVIPSDQTIEFGNSFSYDVSATDLSGIDHYLINDTSNFNINSAGLITNKSVLTVGIYWLNVSAFDASDNYCDAQFRVIVLGELAQQWNVTWGGGSGESGGRVAVDSLGYAYVTGSTESFGVNTDMFLVKYDSSGAQLWNTTWGGDDLDVAHGVAVDSLDNVYISGFTVSFGPGGYDLCLVKFNSSGAQQWNVTWGGSDVDVGYKVTVDSSDNVYVTGYTKSFGIVGNDDICLVKYNSSGAKQWNVTWGGSGAESGIAVAMDASDNVYVSGSTTSFGAGGSDMCLVKYNSSGVQLWNTTWGGGNYEHSEGVAVDSSDNVYLTGHTTSFGAGGYDMCLVKYNSSGVQLWNTTWGGGLGEYGYDVAVDSSDSVYVAGHTTTFGSGGFDIFLVKYDSSGVQLWNTTWGGGDHDYGGGIDIDSSYNVYFAGTTASFGVGILDILLVKYGQQGRIAPSWVEAPSDQLNELGVSFSYDLSATDSSGIDHYLINDTTYFTIDSTGEITNKTILTIGTYWLNVSAFDPYDNYCDAQFKVTVSDTVAPTWDEIPTSQFFLYNQNVAYDVNATDLAGIDNYWINDTIHFTINTDGLIQNATILECGEYWVEIRAIDPGTLYCSEIFKIVIYEHGSPESISTGTSNFETDPIDTTKYSVNFTFDLSGDALALFYSSILNPAAVNLGNYLLFIEIILNDTSNLNELNITILYLGAESLENLKGWWFNESANAWDELSIIIVGNKIIISVDHASFFALSGTEVQSSVPSGDDDDDDDGGSSGGEGDDSGDGPITIIIIIIIIVIGSVAGLAGGTTYSKKSKTKKVSNQKDLKHMKASSAQRKREKLMQTKAPTTTMTEEPKKDITQEERIKKTTPPIKSAVEHKKAKQIDHKKVKTSAMSTPTTLGYSVDEEEELKKTESEIDLEERGFLCVVHKGDITGNMYVCPRCKSIYCERCAKALKIKGEKCWSCESEITVAITEADKAEILKDRASTILDNLIEDNRFLKEYLESNKSYETIPEIRSSIISILNPEDLKKIDLLGFSIDEKKQFIKEILLVEGEQREQLLEEILNLKD